MTEGKDNIKRDSMLCYSSHRTSDFITYLAALLVEVKPSADRPLYKVSAKFGSDYERAHPPSRVLLAQVDVSYS